MHHLISPNIAYIKAILCYALVHIIVFGIGMLWIFRQWDGFGYLAFSLNNEDGDKNFSRHTVWYFLEAFFAYWEDEELCKVGIVDVVIRTTVNASPCVLHLHKTSALREPRLVCSPKAANLTDFKNKTCRYRFMPPRQPLYLQVLNNGEVLPLKLLLNQTQLLLGGGCRRGKPTDAATKGQTFLLWSRTSAIDTTLLLHW